MFLSDRRQISPNMNGILFLNLNYSIKLLLEIHQENKTKKPF
jgi:hypothetical protein